MPGQSQLLTGRACFTEAYAVIPGETMRDIVSSQLPHWQGTRLWVLARPLSGFAETHVMEHGLFVLKGKAVYRLNQDWVEVEAGDFMWLRAFCPQACYAGGPGRFRYLLYKDVNRHMPLRLP